MHPTKVPSRIELKDMSWTEWTDLFHTRCTHYPSHHTCDTPLETWHLLVWRSEAFLQNQRTDVCGDWSVVSSFSAGQHISETGLVVCRIHCSDQTGQDSFCHKQLVSWIFFWSQCCLQWFQDQLLPTTVHLQSKDNLVQSESTVCDPNL